MDRLRPDLLIVSGDFVEHATEGEFELARQFLDRLPQPRLAVPGNHDLPFYDPLRRIRQGLRSYRRFITDDLAPVFQDDEMIVAGLSTPRVFPMKGGRISAEQVEQVRQLTCGLPPAMVKVLVTHHPLDVPAPLRRAALVHRARAGVMALAPCIDLMLAGHLHLSSTGSTAARYSTAGRPVIFAQAGTAISMRNKGEPNSFNVIRLSASEIEIQHQTWNSSEAAYQPRQWDRFDRGPQGWAIYKSP